MASTNVNGYEIVMDKLADGYSVFVNCTIKGNQGVLDGEAGIDDKQVAHELFVAYVTWYGQGMYKYYGTRPTEEWRKEHKYL